jgi:hypothetical protein
MAESSRPACGIAPASLLFFLLWATAPALPAQQCPTGVLDHDRAYFGTTLSTNRCTVDGGTCDQVFFFSQQGRSTAVCRSGRWSPENEAPAPASGCPEYVFGDGEIWDDGSYLPNSCDETSAPVCRGTYFYRLPGGGAGYQPAVCVAGRWRPQGDAEAFRLQRARTSSELADYLRLGLRATYGGDLLYAFGPPLAGEGPSGGGPAPPAGPTVSQTNVQEVGVDEEDRIKSDGEVLYVLRNHQTLQKTPSGGSRGNRVRILELDPKLPSATPLSEVEVAAGEGQQARGMYLRAEADQLFVTASNSALDWYYWYSPLAWLRAESTVARIDVGDPKLPVQDATIELDGDIVSSRRIDDILYLATRFHPFVPGLDPFDPDHPGAADQIARIEQASLSELLPSYRSTAFAESRLLVDPRDCYLPTPDAPVKTADVVTLVAIDLDTMELVSSKCFVGATETIYVSLESMYLASTRYDYSLVPGPAGIPEVDYRQPSVETDLHKFSLDSGVITYRASGSVDGHLGWQLDRKPFRLSERDDDLRVITYTDELTEDRSPVAVTVLRDTGDDELKVLARLPNERRPDPIGKPGEELYATRFVADRAYLVTFLITDPLYVIDFSRPEDPFVAGELEITGYSDYLHPFENGYVLGIGKDAIPDPSGDFRGAWYQGVKIALYDVADPANPYEADAVLIGKRGSDTPVLHDHRAFTFLPAVEGRSARVAIGAVVHDRSPTGGQDHPSRFYQWSHSGLHLFEVDTASGRLVRRGEMQVEHFDPSSPYAIRGEDRSVLTTDAIFYVHGDDVFTGLWSDPGSFEGPR